MEIRASGSVRPELTRESSCSRMGSTSRQADKTRCRHRRKLCEPPAWLASSSSAFCAHVLEKVELVARSSQLISLISLRAASSVQRGHPPLVRGLREKQVALPAPPFPACKLSCKRNQSSVGDTSDAQVLASGSRPIPSSMNPACTRQGECLGGLLKG